MVMSDGQNSTSLMERQFFMTTREKEGAISTALFGVMAACLA
jgi:hypothetical protein